MNISNLCNYNQTLNISFKNKETISTLINKSSSEYKYGYTREVGDIEKSLIKTIQNLGFDQNRLTKEQAR
ncbi:hypothetical protein GW796_06630 [archaeon]|nr:hypothetical protein [archaeon]